MKTEKTIPTKMSFETYSYIEYLLKDVKKRFEKEYMTSLHQLGYENKKYIIQAHEKMEETYNSKINKIDTMINELKYAAMMSEGPNISKEMKAFWGY